MNYLSGEKLKKYNYFSKLSDGALEELAGKIQQVEIEPGTMIIQEGTSADAFYFIKEGEVEVTKKTNAGETVKISVISSGQGFGEVALLTCSRRCSSVISKNNVKLFKLNKTDFENIIMTDSSFTSMLLKRVSNYEHYNRMKTLQPFQLLEPEKMVALTDRMTEKKFASGENIINQDEKGDLFYIIKSGKVSVLVKKKDEEDPEQVAVLGEGDSFGEEAIIRDQRRNATVRAEEETIVLVLDKKDFDSILKASFLDFAFPEDIPLDNTDNYFFLDARIPPEYEEEHIAGAVNIPLEELRQKYKELDPSKEYVTYCTNDSRGMAAAFLLKNHGFNAKNLRGGLSGWTGEVETGSDGIHLPKTSKGE